VTGQGTGAGRIGGLDLARGLAVLGMFGAHLGLGDELTPDPASWAAVVEGRSSILFATLAGVSLALLSGRTRPVEGTELVRARMRILVRAVWVFAIGAVLEWLDTFVAIILGVYAVLFVLALPFLRWSPRRAFLAAGALALAGPPLLVLLGQLLSVADAESHYVARLLVTGTYPALLWVAFVLVGLGIGRLDLADSAVRLRLAAAGAAASVLGYGAGWLGTRLLGDGGASGGPADGFAAPVGEWQVAWLTGAEPHSGTTAELVGSTGFAVLVVAASLAVADRLPLPTAPLRAVGALALSVYSAHIVVLWALMQVDPRPQGLGLWLLLAGSALAVAGVWRWRIGPGPLERLLTWSSTGAAGMRPERPVRTPPT
jgi:uncharacterized membrane protein YeiB